MTPLASRGRRRLLAAAALAALAAPRVHAGSAAPSALWVLAEGGTRLLALEPDELRIRRSLATPVLRAAALGDGGQLLLLAGPGLLLLLDSATLQEIRRWPLPSAAGAEVHDAPARRSFVAAPAGLPELWEISYDPHAEDQYEGLVHDFRMGEGMPVRGHLYARRTRMPQPLADIALDAEGLLVLGSTSPGAPLEGWNLDARRRAGIWRFDGSLPRPGRGAWLQHGGRVRLAMPDAQQPLVHWLDAQHGGNAPPLVLPAPARRLLAGAASGTLWAVLDDALLRIDVERGAQQRVAALPPGVLALHLLPGDAEALLLVGGAPGELLHLDLARGETMRRQDLADPLAMAPSGMFS